MSTQAVGANARLIYGFGSTTSALPDSPEGIVLYYQGGESFDSSQEELDSNIISNNPNPSESMDGATTVSGGFSTELSYQLALLLKLHFGSYSGSGPTVAVKAQVSGLGTYNSVIEASTAGFDGNAITVALVGDSAAAAGVTITRSGTAFTIHYESGVSTVADVDAAITALAGANDLIAVKTAGTGATVLTAPGANHVAAALSGGVTAGIYTEVFKLGAITDYMWLEKGFTDLDVPKYFPFVGHRIAKYSYDRKATGPIGVSFDIPGLRDLPLADTTVDATPVDLGHSPFNAKKGDILIDSVSVGTITSAKFDSSRNAKPSEPIIGSQGYSTQIPVGRATIKGSLTSLFESTELFDKAATRATVSVLLKDFNGDGSGTAGNESMETYFAETHLSKKTPSIKDDTGVMLETDYTAFHKSDAAGSAIVVTIKHSSAVLHGLLNP